MELDGKVALVTGGGRGIGRETARLLAQHGARVAVLSRTAAEAEETAAMIVNDGGEAMAIAGDVRLAQDIDQACRLIREKWGFIDILINNAGAMSLKPFTEVSIEEWDWIQEVNVRGAFLCARAVVPQMIEKQSGVIVNVSSIWGTKGGPNRSAYITSKFAVNGFTKALGEELKPYNIRVNAVCPGPVATKMMDDIAPGAKKDDWLHPRDLAHIIVDLCLPKTKAISAAIIEAFGNGRPVGL